MTQHAFRPALSAFLRELASNNTRDRFRANKGRYEDYVRGQALGFIAEYAPGLEEISHHFVADPRPSGRSLFRIHHDVRFSKDKRPYKTTTGIHLRHEAAKNAYAPGYYLHLEPRNVFIGIGIWHPETKVARQIRNAIAENPTGWKRARDPRSSRRSSHSKVRV
ncbi:MAG: hypothetical protein ACI841_002651 [Planctomycetota bacterium]|jgi:uncharacterized protein (TIGR02453 family)